MYTQRETILSRRNEMVSWKDFVNSRLTANGHLTAKQLKQFSGQIYTNNEAKICSV